MATKKYNTFHFFKNFCFVQKVCVKKIIIKWVRFFISLKKFPISSDNYNIFWKKTEVFRELCFFFGHKKYFFFLQKINIQKNANHILKLKYFWAFLISWHTPRHKLATLQGAIRIFLPWVNHVWASFLAFRTNCLKIAIIFAFSNSSNLYFCGLTKIRSQLFYFFSIFNFPLSRACIFCIPVTINRAKFWKKIILNTVW